MSRLSDWLIVGVAQFIRRERSDLSHLIHSELVRQRSGFDAEGDRFTAFIDSMGHSWTQLWTQTPQDGMIRASTRRTDGFGN